MNAKQTKAAAKKTADEPRRPAVNPPMPDELFEKLGGLFSKIRTILEEHAAHLRALDRKRLLGIGIKTQGFISRVSELVGTNPEFLPYYLPVEKYREDYAYYTGFRSLYDDCKQIDELLWNITILSGHASKTNALGFYAMVREAAKRRIDPAETMYKELEVFFKKHKRTEKQTMKKTVRDANALLHGKRNGKLVIENISPKLTGATHNVIDETFNDNEQ